MTYPYPQQQPYSPDPLAPARRAALGLFILGALMASFGLCNAVSTFAVNTDEWVKSQQMFLPPGQTPQISPEILKTVAIVMAFVVVITGVLLGILGAPVRQGSRGACIAALVLNGIILAVLALFILSVIVTAFAAPPAAALLCFLVVPAAAFGWQLYALVRALRGISAMRTWQNVYAAQYWQYYQQQQAYAQGPYTPPPAMAPPGAMPPAQPPQDSNAPPPAG